MGEPYAHPEVLVSADWVEAHLKDPKVRIVESDEDILLYDLAHIPGAVRIDWQGDLQDQLVRDYINAEKFAALCSKAGIANDTTVVFYGDKSNWWACYAFWAFKLFGHPDCRILNGGRKLWLDQGRPTTTEIPSYPPTRYTVQGNDEERIRIFRDAVAVARQGRAAADRRPQSQGIYRRDVAHGGLSPGRRAPRRPHSRAPRTCPGAAPSTKTAPSSRSPSSRRSMKTKSA